MESVVEVGDYDLEPGNPAGTSIRAIQGARGVEARALAQALERPPPPDTSDKPPLAAGVEEAAEATAKLERAVALAKGVGEGRALDPTQLGLEVGALLDCLERLDRKKEHKKSLQMARALATLLMLLKRWADLLKTLRLALRAGEQLRDQEAVAWARHELGTLRLAAGDVEGADRELRQAREIRERIGDRHGLATTERNMQVLCDRVRTMLQSKELVRPARSRLTPRSALIASLFAFLFAAAGFGAGSMVGESDSPGNSSSAAGGGEPSGGSQGSGERPSVSTGGEETGDPEIATDPEEPELEPEPTPELEPEPEPIPTTPPPPPAEEPFRAPR